MHKTENFIKNYMETVLHQQLSSAIEGLS